MDSTARRDLIFLCLLCCVDFALAAWGADLWRCRPRAPHLPGAAFIPILFGLTVVLHRCSEQFERRSLLLPMTGLSLLFFFCLLVDFPVLAWGFMTPNLHPIAVRLCWVWLLILGWHPWVAEKLWCGWKAVRVYVRNRRLLGVWFPILAVFLFMVGWLLRSGNVEPDGYDWMWTSATPGRWTYYLREPLALLIYRFSFLIFGAGLGWSWLTCIGLVSIFSGIAVVPLVVWTLRRFVPNEESRSAYYLLLIGCGGFTVLFAGNVEVYALLTLGFWCFLATGVKYAAGQWRMGLVGLLFGTVACLHLSFVFWIPGLAALPWLLNPTETNARARIGESATALGTMLLFPFLFGIVITMVGYEYDPILIWNTFWGEQVLKVGTDRAMFRNVSDYITAGTYLTYANFLFCLVPALLGWLLLWFVAAVKPEPGKRLREWGWFLVLLLPYLAVLFTWRPDKHPNVDWDLFSGVVSPLFLVICGRIVPHSGMTAERRIILTQIAWWGILFTLLQIGYHHGIKITDWPIPR